MRECILACLSRDINAALVVTIQQGNGEGALPLIARLNASISERPCFRRLVRYKRTVQNA
jgi:hypothetical protein